MKRGLVLEFTKMHGAGNDFIVIDNRFYYFSGSELAEIAQRFCPRHFGIGADGVLALENPRSHGQHYFMSYVNADGSVGEMCGNGARCLARFAVEAGIEGSQLRFGTIAGEYQADVRRDTSQVVRLILPRPDIVTPSFSRLTIEGNTYDLTYVNAGVPHAVCFASGIDRLAVETLGSTIRHHADFIPTGGANVDFVEVDTRGEVDSLSVRCYERGVESETLACGTGAVSSFVAAFESGLITGSEVSVEMPGGSLRVGFTADRSGIFLEGNAVSVYRGTVEL